MLENKNSGLKKPIILFVLAGIAFAYALIFRLVLQPPVSSLVTILPMLAFTLVYTQNKVLWSVSITWLFCAIILAVPNFIAGGFEPAQLIGTTIFLALDVACIFAILGHFKYPYLNSRSSFVGFGERQNASLDATLKVDGKDLSVKVIDVSSSGIGIKVSQDVFAQIPENKIIDISIPGIQNFQSKVSAARKHNDFVGLQFRGWSVKSMGEHSKIVLWLSKNSRLAKQHGFTLIEALIVVGISSVLILGVSQIFVDVNKTSKASNLAYQIQSTKEQIGWALRDNASWANTVADPNNVEIACVKNKTSCSGITAFVPVDVRNSANTVILNSHSATSGFDWNGAACNTFDSVNGNDKCPIRIVVQAKPHCEGMCTSPSLELQTTVSFLPKTKSVVVNVNKYTTSIYRDTTIDLISDNCKSINGTWNTNGTCTFDLFVATCSAHGQYLVGVDAGQPVCESMTVGTTCPVGKWLQGFDGAGSAICI